MVKVTKYWESRLNLKSKQRVYGVTIEYIEYKLDTVINDNFLSV